MRSLLVVVLLTSVVGSLSEDADAAAAASWCDNREVSCLTLSPCPPVPPLESCCSKQYYTCYNNGCKVCLKYIEETEGCERFVEANIACRPPAVCAGSVCKRI